jgi:uncharacterized protein YprB with RNaseH-like and TPR domain
MTKHDDHDALVATANTGGMEGYRAYLALGGTRSFDGWEVRRRRVGAADAPRVTVEPAGPDYVGLSVGYFDIETTFSTQPIVLYAAIADGFGKIRQFRRGPDITDDRELVGAYADALSEYDILVSWNGKLFDVPVIQARLAYHGLRRLDLNMHVDLMYYATGQFMRMGRKSLQSVSEYFEVSNQKTPLRVRQWDGAMAGKPEEYEKIVEHCDADVLVLRDVFPVLKRHVRTIHRAG